MGRYLSAIIPYTFWWIMRRLPHFFYYSFHCGVRTKRKKSARLRMRFKHLAKKKEKVARRSELENSNCLIYRSWIDQKGQLRGRSSLVEKKTHEYGDWEPLHKIKVQPIWISKLHTEEKQAKVQEKSGVTVCRGWASAKMHQLRISWVLVLLIRGTKKNTICKTIKEDNTPLRRKGSLVAVSWAIRANCGTALQCLGQNRRRETNLPRSSYTPRTATPAVNSFICYITVLVNGMKPNLYKTLWSLNCK